MPISRDEIYTSYLTSVYWSPTVYFKPESKLLILPDFIIVLKSYLVAGILLPYDNYLRFGLPV